MDNRKKSKQIKTEQAASIDRLSKFTNLNKEDYDVNHNKFYEEDPQLRELKEENKKLKESINKYKQQKIEYRNTIEGNIYEITELHMILDHVKRELLDYPSLLLSQRKKNGLPLELDRADCIKIINNVKRIAFLDPRP